MIHKIISDVMKDPKKAMIVIAASVVLALALYLNFLLMPQLKKISGVMGKLNKTSSDLKAAEADIANIDSMKATIEAYKTKVGRYEKMLPSEDRIPELLESLSELAKASNMRIVGILPVEKKLESPQGRVYRDIPIMIGAKAGYHELGRFMSSLENSDRLMKISDMQIKANRAFPKRHDVELLVSTYVLTEGK